MDEENKEEVENSQDAENKENVKEAANEVKGETINAFNQVKDTMKNTDFKEEAKNTKGFLIEFVSRPVELVTSVARGERSVLATGLFLMAVTIVVNIIKSIISVFRYSGFHLMTFVRDITYPVVYILVLAIVVLLLNRKSKKSLLTIIEVLILAYVPNIINNAISLITTIIHNITLSEIIACATTAIAIIATLLRYFGIKELFDEEDDSKFVKTFFIIMLIHQVCMYVIGLTNII